MGLSRHGGCPKKSSLPLMDFQRRQTRVEPRHASPWPHMAISVRNVILKSWDGMDFQILRQPYVETQVEHSHSCLLVQQEGSHLSYPGESMMHGIRYVEKTRAFTRWYYGKHMCKDMPYSLKRWRPKMPTGGAENTSDGFIMIMIDAASHSRLDCNICVYVYIIIYIL